MPLGTHGQPPQHVAVPHCTRQVLTKMSTNDLDKEWQGPKVPMPPTNFLIDTEGHPPGFSVTPSMFLLLDLCPSLVLTIPSELVTPLHPP